MQTRQEGLTKTLNFDRYVEEVMELAKRENIVSAKIFDTRLAALILGTDTDYFATYNTKHFKEIEGLNPLTPPQILTELC